MANMKDILVEKGSHVLTIGPQATVLEAAMLMNDHKVGSVVVREDEQVAGIFTERDVLRRVVAAGRDPAATTVGEVMTTHVVCCEPQTSVEEARSVMKNRRIRHLPVMESDRTLVGLISIGDLNAYQLDGQEVTIHFLHEYLYGRV